MDKNGDTVPMTTEDEDATEETAFGEVAKDAAAVTTTSANSAIKNLLVLSMAFLLLFTAFQSLQNLQSSLNKEEGMGTVSLSVIYVFSMLSGLLLPPLVIRHIGCKWTIAASISCYIVYMAANFHAVWGTMIPASIIIGIGSSPLWTAKCTYLTYISEQYADLTNTAKDGVLSTFFGVFFMFFQTSQIWGNLISSLVFKQIEANATSEEALSRCGANYCPSDYINNTNRKDLHLVWYIHRLCLPRCSCHHAVPGQHQARHALLAGQQQQQQQQQDPGHRHHAPLLQLTLPEAHDSTHCLQRRGTSLHVRRIHSIIHQLFYRSMECGVCDDSLRCGSIIVGRLVKFTSFVPWFALGFLVHGGTQVTLLLWKPSSDAMFVFYLLAVPWGIGDAVMQTLINDCVCLLEYVNEQPVCSGQCS